MNISHLRIKFEGMDIADFIEQTEEQLKNIENCVFNGFPFFIEGNGRKIFVNMDKVLFIEFHYGSEVEK